jgi:segregation and condensation protein B
MLKFILEAALFAVGQPLSIKRMQTLFASAEDEKPSTEEIHAALKALQEDYEGRGIALKELASGFCFQTQEQVHPWLKNLWEEKPQRHSRAFLETLALIAYRQPITRGEIEAIRGVSVNPNIIRTLLDKEWIRVVGQRDLPGKPELFATTLQFLDHFNLKSLEDLPDSGSGEEGRSSDFLNPALALEKEKEV